MVYSLYNLLALSAVAHAAIKMETAVVTEWKTVIAGAEAAAPTSSADTHLPSTTTIQIPVASGKKDIVLTLGSEGGYEIVAPATTSAAAHHAHNNFANTPAAIVPSSSAAPTSQAPAPTTSEAPAPTTSEAPAPTTSQAPAPSDSGSDGLSGIAKECVDYHNKVRADHQADPVTWDDKLASFASDYLNGNCNFAHSGGPYGENIAMGYQDPTAAMKAWYDENKDYDYSSGQFGENTGHFTQMVWKGTKKIGCAQSDCPDGKYFVCEYADARGNVIGQFVQNVLPQN